MLKLQYFGHLLQRAESLKKPLMLGKIEDWRRKGPQGMRWLDGITDLMDMNLSNLWEMVMVRAAWHVAVHEVAKSWTDWATELSWSESCSHYHLIFLSVLSLSHVRLFETQWTEVHQASLSITNSQNLLKFMSLESVRPSNHFILCHPLLLPPSIFPSIRVFSKESILHYRWPKYWSFSIGPSNEY